ARICETITLSMFAPRVSMFLVSMPARVSNSAISSGLFGRSTNSRSQLTENFIFFLAPNREHRHSACVPSGHGVRGSPGSRLKLCWAHRPEVYVPVDGSCELFQKPQIVLRKKPDVGNLEQNHREAIHAEAERVAGPLFGIVSFIAPRFVDRFENG